MYKIIITSLVFLLSVYEVISAPKHQPCPLLKLKNGRVRYRQRNRFVRFTCIPGYLIAGERYSTCENGSWDGVLPKCVRSSCVKVNAPAHALIYTSHRGGVLNFFCKPGYTLRGFNATYCDGYIWDNNLPTCIEANTQPALSCDFENEDLCGWNHDLRHDFDWKRKNVKTQSGYLGTGLHYDHTKGEGGDGYYMHIEATFRSENDTARLISPIYDKINTDVCFEFYYYMHGSTTGQLRVYLKKESQSWYLDPSNAFFWKLGNHGEKWLQSWHFLGSIDEDFQIIIEGVRGTSSNGDIAIDDIRLVPNCTADELTTESDIEYTFDDDRMQSCVNRCDVASNTTYQCDCDENCIDNNRCCLDYIYVCVLGGSDDYSTTAVYTTYLEPTATATTTKAALTTTKPTTSETTTRTTTKTTTRKGTIPNTTKTTPLTTRASKTFPHTTATVRTTTRKATTPRTTKRITTTIKRTKPTTVNTKKANTSPTTNIKSTIKMIYSTKLIQTRWTTPSRQKTPKSMKPTANSTLSVKIPKTTTTSHIEIDDVLTIPQVPDDTDDYPNFTPSLVPVKQNQNTAHVTSDNETEVNMNPSVRVIILITCSIAFVLVLIMLTILLIKRHRLRWCRINNMKNTISDSQSDVRFLTSDEILNFNLAYCDD